MRSVERRINGLGVRVPNAKPVAVQNPSMIRIESPAGVIVDNPKLYRAFPRYCMRLEGARSISNMQETEGLVVYNRIYGKAK